MLNSVRPTVTGDAKFLAKNRMTKDFVTRQKAIHLVRIRLGPS
jgi:hypothetical protein